MASRSVQVRDECSGMALWLITFRICMASSGMEAVKPKRWITRPIGCLKRLGTSGLKPLKRPILRAAFVPRGAEPDPPRTCPVANPAGGQQQVTSRRTSRQLKPHSAHQENGLYPMLQRGVAVDRWCCSTDQAATGVSARQRPETLAGLN